MTAPPLVTIVIPTYNRSARLSETILSALGQSYPNVEVIVVDDGSTDNTPDLVAKLCRQHENLSYLRYTPNQGANIARNLGIDSAQGEYICFLDSDDTYLPDKISKQMAVAQTLPVGRDHVVQCQIAYIVDGEVRPTHAIRAKSDDENPGDYIFLNGGQSHTPLCLVNTSLARRVRFDADLPKLQDFDWYIRLMSEDVVYAFIPEALATYRISHSEQQISKTLPSFFVMNQWANAIAPFLTPRSLAWLRANKLAIYASAEQHHFTAIRYVLNGIRLGVAPPKRLLGVMGRMCMSDKHYEKLARTFFS